MESKEGKKFNYKITGLVAIAVVAAIVGTLTFTSFQNNSDLQTQSIGIGAYVTVEAYHEDGTLFQKWEGHNDLNVYFRNALVFCITGQGNNPPFIGSCDMDFDSILINDTDGDTPFTSETQSSQITFTPENCDPSSSRIQLLCTGWIMTSTFDFDTLSCDPNGSDCPKIIQLAAVSAVHLGTLNFFNLDSIINIVPNDRLLVTMEFTIPS